MSEERPHYDAGPFIERRAALPVRRFAIVLTRRDLPSPLLSVLVSALENGPGNHEAPELRAVFIEDADLLNAVALPFTHELCGVTHAMRPINRAGLEAHFARESAAAATSVAELTRLLGRQCHFEVLRARKAHALSTTLAGVDALFLPGTRPANASVASAPMLALLDDSASAGNCLRLARRLAAAVGAPLLLRRLASSERPADDELLNVTRDDVPALLARRDLKLVLLAANLVPQLAHSAVELDELCAAPLLVVN